MERDGDLGYMALAVQTNKNTVAAAAPSVFLPIYNCEIKTNPNFQRQNPIIGSKYRSRSTLRGQREHTGSMIFEGEPVAALYAYDMLLTRGTSSGTAPSVTQPYGLSKTADPKYYTVDVSYVSQVVRYVGLTASEVEESWQDNELRLNLAVACLKVWDGRTISAISGSGPYTITFTQDYDRNPTTGLIAGDTMQLYDVSTQAYINFVIATIVNGTQITTTTNPAPGAAGDFITLRPVANPTFSNGPTFTFADTEYRFADTAANALTAAHTPLESDTTFKQVHPFNEDAGTKRSGSRDPYSLPRMQGGYDFGPKIYFDTPDQMMAYSSMTKRACVIRHFSYNATNTYELRHTLNNMTQSNPLPSLEPESIMYSELEMMDNLDATDGQGMSTTVIAPIALPA